MFATEETVIHECRYCGTTLDSTDDSCPVCGSTDVATYRF
ncbi:hypothetical protein HSB1_42580 [Halogranum salarium B-1]|uniref:Rubrerythrin-like domain-containing protein n=1 Tax=Halogranum salarium B-1 TaxID=1210908 RepID=J2Z9I6_9EURY|nr:hypothetical protein HSB1_42580 [Halogranum salarium B-1]